MPSDVVHQTEVRWRCWQGISCTRSLASATSATSLTSPRYFASLLCLFAPFPGYHADCSRGPSDEFLGVQSVKSRRGAAARGGPSCEPVCILRALGGVAKLRGPEQEHWGRVFARLEAQAWSVSYTHSSICVNLTCMMCVRGIAAPIGAEGHVLRCGYEGFRRQRLPDGQQRFKIIRANHPRDLKVLLPPAVPGTPCDASAVGPSEASRSCLMLL
eukprot:3463618-Rhodomonas_salina.3